MSGSPAGIPDADRNMADQIIMIAAIVCGVFALLALVNGNIMGLVIDGALAAALWFLGLMKLRAGDLQTAKMVALGVGAVLVLLSLLVIGAGYLLVILIGLVGFATGAALIYAAMLLSPGRKLI